MYSVSIPGLRGPSRWPIKVVAEGCIASSISLRPAACAPKPIPPLRTLAGSEIEAVYLRRTPGLLLKTSKYADLNAVFQVFSYKVAFPEEAIGAGFA